MAFIAQRALNDKNGRNRCRQTGATQTKKQLHRAHATTSQRMAGYGTVATD
jgi:hypothetical protein